MIAHVRQALRGFRRSKGFTLTIVLTFGIGIGLNAAIFAVIDCSRCSQRSCLRGALPA